MLLLQACWNMYQNVKHQIFPPKKPPTNSTCWNMKYLSTVSPLGGKQTTRCSMKKKRKKKEIKADDFDLKGKKKRQRASTPVFIVGSAVEPENRAGVTGLNITGNLSRSLRIFPPWKFGGSSDRRRFSRKLDKTHCCLSLFTLLPFGEG